MESPGEETGGGQTHRANWLGKLRVTSLSPFTVLCFKEEQARGVVHHAGLSTTRLKIKTKATFSAGSSVISAEPRSVKSLRLRCYLLFNDLGGKGTVEKEQTAHAETTQPINKK